MSGFKGTPGPWRVAGHSEENPEKLSVEDCYGYFIAEVDFGIAQQANANLIAEAPALLDSAQLALSIAESWIHDQLDGTSYLESAMQSLDPVRAAIRKALGEE